jgi:hypothetical protein
MPEKVHVDVEFTVLVQVYREGKQWINLLEEN